MLYFTHGLGTSREKFSTSAPDFYDKTCEIFVEVSEYNLNLVEI